MSRSATDPGSTTRRGCTENSPGNGRRGPGSGWPVWSGCRRRQSGAAPLSTVGRLAGLITGSHARLVIGGGNPSIGPTATPPAWRSSERPAGLRSRVDSAPGSPVVAAGTRTLGVRHGRAGVRRSCAAQAAPAKMRRSTRCPNGLPSVPAWISLSLILGKNNAELMPVTNTESTPTVSVPIPHLRPPKSHRQNFLIKRSCPSHSSDGRLSRLQPCWASRSDSRKSRSAGNKPREWTEQTDALIARNRPWR